MLRTIAVLYVTLLPAILAGIFNMAWCKAPVAQFLSRPIDGGKTLRDQQRIFGSNKTWKGVVGMVGLGALFNLAWGFICAANPKLEALNDLYRNFPNTLLYNLALGAAFGLAYAAFELPNSFAKRRLGITPGKPPAGVWKPFFIFVDQADSVIGLLLVLIIVAPLSPLVFLLYVLLGAATHILFNVLLYAVHLRANPL